MTREQLKRMWRTGEGLEELTNAQLDLKRRADDDARAELARLKMIVEVEAFIREAKDYARMERLSAMVDALPGVPVRAVNRKVGRPKGSDPDVVKAYADVARIRDIWQRTFGTHYRKASPTAIDIAARQHGLAAERLDNYRKNRNGR